MEMVKGVSRAAETPSDVSHVLVVSEDLGAVFAVEKKLLQIDVLRPIPNIFPYFSLWIENLKLWFVLQKRRSKKTMDL